MENQRTIVQLRASIFYPQNIGYSPENSRKYKDIFLPDGEISQFGMQPIANFSFPQPQIGIGMPWQLVQKLNNNGSKNEIVSFLPGKIDIVRNDELITQDQERTFINSCSKRFTDCLSDLKIPATRIASCPTVAILLTGSDDYTIWNQLLKQSSYEGIPYKDINLSYLIKKTQTLKGQTFAVNFLHKICNGIQIKEGKKTADCLLVQIDMNTVPDQSYQFNSNQIEDFLVQSISWKENIIDHIHKTL
jgi:hypothetical protein